MREPSELEALLLLHIRAEGLPEPRREYPFAAPVGRKFRADFAYPYQRLLIECEGGVWLDKGGHSTGDGITRDCHKQNLATLLGFRVLRFTAAMVEDGTAIEILRAALAGSA